MSVEGRYDGGDDGGNEKAMIHACIVIYREVLATSFNQRLQTLEEEEAGERKP